MALDPDTHDDLREHLADRRAECERRHQASAETSKQPALQGRLAALDWALDQLETDPATETLLIAARSRRATIRDIRERSLATSADAFLAGHAAVIEDVITGLTHLQTNGEP